MINKLLVTIFQNNLPKTAERANPEEADQTELETVYTYSLDKTG